jgi:putative transposase
MGTFTQSLYQIVYSTKFREPTLVKAERELLYQDIWGILKKKNCHLYRIGGIEDHLHIITSLHPAISLADLVKDIKLGSTSFIKEKNIFPEFRGWQGGYAAFTYSQESKNNLIEYVKNQEEHHIKKNFKEELIDLLNEHGVDFDEKYLD